ncbi:hypothetical protein GCM10008965_49840 [Methylorubrum aminovorans]
MEDSFPRSEKGAGTSRPRLRIWEEAGKIPEGFGVLTKRPIPNRSRSGEDGAPGIL